MSADASSRLAFPLECHMCQGCKIQHRRSAHGMTALVTKAFAGLSCLLCLLGPDTSIAREAEVEATAKARVDDSPTNRLLHACFLPRITVALTSPTAARHQIYILPPCVLDPSDPASHDRAHVVSPHPGTSHVHATLGIKPHMLVQTQAYARLRPDAPELADLTSAAASDETFTARGAKRQRIYEDHLPEADISAGIKRGTLHQVKFGLGIASAVVSAGQHPHGSSNACMDPCDEGTGPPPRNGHLGWH